MEEEQREKRLGAMRRTDTEAINLKAEVTMLRGKIDRLTKAVEKLADYAGRNLYYSSIKVDIDNILKDDMFTISKEEK